MQKLDRSRPFGTISPPYIDDEFDRPAYYEQDARLYDAHDRLIEPGKPIEEDAAPAVEAKDAAADMSPSALLANSSAMPWAAFRKRAREILGETCPAGKADIVVALQEAIQHYEARQQKRAAKAPKAVEGEQKSPGLTWNGLTNQEEPENLTAKPSSKPGDIDLAAWARGQKEYLFGDVRKGIRTKFNVSVTERRDAVNLLIDEKVIAAAEARKDFA